MKAVIGGTGFAEFDDLTDITGNVVKTSFGDAYLERGTFRGETMAFVPRHGHPPRQPPHRINYRANIQALSDIGADSIIAVNAVGGVDASLDVPSLVIPDQIIDYTSGREHTFFQGEIQHIDFTYPFDQALRDQLIAATGSVGNATHKGVYGCTQGPRLETAAEIERLRRDGCDIVGMTAMPEAALAREREIPYASLCVVVNQGAGFNDAPVALDEIGAALEEGMQCVREVFRSLV